jgi:hypothetical protein
MTDDKEKKLTSKQKQPGDNTSPVSVIRHPPSESGGPKGPEPTRYGDWEIAGKCVDF